MADEQKAVAVAGNGQLKALETDNKSKNGLSGEREEPQEAIEPEEKNVPAGEKPSDPTHKDARQKKYTEKTESRKPGTHKHPSTNYRGNVKTDYSALPASRDPAEIRKQVEFYFSDANLSYDDYMRKLVDGSKNAPVPLATLHSFKRMRRFQPVGAVVAALRESATLEVVDGEGEPAPATGEDDEEQGASGAGFAARAHIRRRTPWAPPPKATAAADNDDAAVDPDDPGLPRSIYAKGFGTEGATTQFDVEAYFAPFGPVNMVRLRRKLPERTFKGSAFVEFATEELARAFLESKDRPLWKGGEELRVMSKKEYIEKQARDIEAGKIDGAKRHRYKMYAAVEGGERREKRGGGRDDEERFAGKRRDNKHGRRGGGGGRGGRDRDDRDGGRNGRDGRDRRDDRSGRNGRDSRRDQDDWKARRDDFQKTLKDDDKKDGEGRLEKSVDAKPVAEAEATAAASPPGKRGRGEQGAGEDGGEAKKAKVEEVAAAR